MDKETLLQRKAAIEQRYEELSKNKSEIDTEMNRLQGEHRLVLDLIQATDTVTVEKPKRIRKVREEDAATTTE